MKRDWNENADSLASAALQRGRGIEVEEESDLQDLITLNRLSDFLAVRSEALIAQISPVTTRSRVRTHFRPKVLQEELVRDLRIDSIREAQDEEAWISGLKKYLSGAVKDLGQAEARSCSGIANDY